MPNHLRYKRRVNTKRLFLAFVAAFFFVFGFDWLVHGILLKDAYVALPPGLQRSPDEFGSHFHWLVLGQVITTFMFTMIFARGFGGGGVGAGVCFGVMLALLYVGSNLMVYCMEPYPGSLIAIWSVVGLIKLALAGAIVGSIYKPSSNT
jgi:hypothetical protein